MVLHSRFSATWPQPIWGQRQQLCAGSDPFERAHQAFIKTWKAPAGALRMYRSSTAFGTVTAGRGENVLVRLCQIFSRSEWCLSHFWRLFLFDFIVLTLWKHNTMLLNAVLESLATKCTSQHNHKHYTAFMFLAFDAFAWTPSTLLSSMSKLCRFAAAQQSHHHSFNHMQECQGDPACFCPGIFLYYNAIDLLYGLEVFRVPKMSQKYLDNLPAWTQTALFFTFHILFKSLCGQCVIVLWVVYVWGSVHLSSSTAGQTVN